MSIKIFIFHWNELIQIMEIGVVLVMRQSQKCKSNPRAIIINPNGDYYNEMEKLRYVDENQECKEFRHNRRMKAVNKINELEQFYGCIGNIPDDNRELQIVRDLLGGYDDHVIYTNVEELNKRINHLARKHRVRIRSIYHMLAYFLDLSTQTVQIKITSNGFTLAESDIVWNQMDIFEQVENLNYLVRMHSVLRRDQRRARNLERASLRHELRRV